MKFLDSIVAIFSGKKKNEREIHDKIVQKRAKAYQELARY